MTIHGDVEIENPDEPGDPRSLAGLPGKEPAPAPKRPQKSYLRLIPEGLQGLINRASATTGIDREDLAERVVKAVLEIAIADIGPATLTLAKQLHADRQAQVEAELSAAAQEVTHA